MPHSEPDKAVSVGEAAHIRGARPGSARYDGGMTDEERSAPDNGIWLCRPCAKLIDADPGKYAPDVLHSWKEKHEQWVVEGKPQSAAAREIHVSGGGTGSIIISEGGGTGLDIEHRGKGPAERIVVDGPGIGEVISQSGPGTGKRIVSTGGGSASETVARSGGSASQVIGTSVKAVLTSCPGCGNMFQATRVIQGFVGDELPQMQVACPQCGRMQTV